jgi:hypothetical protein
MALKNGDLSKIKAVNRRVAQFIIILHEDGYIYDFILVGNLQIQCVQESSTHTCDEVNINRIGLCGSSPQRLLIAIETATGIRGILHTVLCIKCFDLLNKKKLLSEKRLINSVRLKLHETE